MHWELWGQEAEFKMAGARCSGVIPALRLQGHLTQVEGCLKTSIEILAASLMAAIVIKRIEYFSFSTVSVFPTCWRPLATAL